MDQGLQVFIFENKKTRVVLVEGEPWWVAADVCNVLEIGTEQTRRLDNDEKGLHLTQTLGGNQEMVIVNEAGLYNLILGSRKPEARAFKRWITHEVLPAIRKTGVYVTPQRAEELFTNPDNILKIVQNWKEERERRLVLEGANLALAARAEEDRPKVLFADSVSASHTSILVGDLAKLLRQNGVEVGQNRLFERLRNEGYLMKGGSSHNMPTQRSMELGLFEVKETTINRPDGGIDVKKTTKVTGRGQVYFVNKFCGEKVA
jgi:anti-repressor protein